MPFIEPEPELRLILVPAPDDPPPSSVEYRRELADFAAALRAQGIEVPLRGRAFDAAGGGGGLPEEFLLIVPLLAPALASFITGAARVTAAWLHAKNGRNARLKVSLTEIEAEDSTREGVEKLFAR